MKELKDWLNHIQTLNPNKIDLGLKNVKAVFDRMQIAPIAKMCIVVAGTNGKGSTLAYLESILFENLISTAKYTSPHIHSFCERITVNKKAVNSDILCKAFEFVESKRESNYLSYFEFTTLAAFYCIKQCETDIALLEIGLGGRLDAVNIIDADISVITNIDIDHQQWLGDTREKIAIEKAGILRNTAPFVCGDRKPPASLENKANEIDAPVYYLGKDFDLENIKGKGCYTDNNLLKNVAMPVMQGEHQLDNLAIALKTIQLLPKNYLLSEELINKGIDKTMVLGRQTLINNNEFPILIDVAHNLAGIIALTKTLNNLNKNKVHCVFSIASDKDIKGIIASLFSVVDYWYIAPMKNDRSIKAKVLTEYLNNKDCVYSQYDSLQQAFISAQKKQKKNELLLVLGSFFVVDELYENLKGYFKEIPNI